MRYVDGKKEQGIRIRRSLEEGLFKLKEIPAPDSPADAPVLRPQTYSDLTGKDKLNYEADINALNWILLGIPNKIFNLLTHVQLHNKCGNVFIDVKASKSKRTARNHDPLALIATSYACPSSCFS
nr:hypothetical protein [Tanacetum cinerariifolium]